MDIVYTYSHLGGEEILMVRHPELYREIGGVIAAIPNPGFPQIRRSDLTTPAGKNYAIPIPSKFPSSLTSSMEPSNNATSSRNPSLLRFSLASMPSCSTI